MRFTSHSYAISTKCFVLSRTDNLGDVVLSLPVAGAIKQQYPDSQVYFIGKSYTRPLIEACQHVDQFLDREALLTDPALLQALQADIIIFLFPDAALARLARRVRIPVRIGTSHRWYHWMTLTQLFSFSRRKSALHEAQLNFKLLGPIPHVSAEVSREEIPTLYGMAPAQPLPANIQKLLDTTHHHLILHPKSKGSAREWPPAKYRQLAEALPADRFHLYLTGTAEEGKRIRQEDPTFASLAHVTDLTGQLSLEALVAFISATDGLVACSTGPLHIAAALGKLAIGLYPPIHPMHPGRWAPLGQHAQYLVLDRACDDCRTSGDCHCIRSLEVQQVLHCIHNYFSTEN